MYRNVRPNSTETAHPLSFRFAVVGVFLLALGGGIAAQELSAEESRATVVSTAPLTFGKVAELAVDADNKVTVLRRSLADKLDELGLSGYLDDITLTLSGSIGGSAEQSLGGDGTARLSAGIDIVPQLTHAGSLSAHDSFHSGPDAEPVPAGSDDSPLAGSVSVAYRPFADPTRSEREQLAADSTAADLDAAIRAARYKAIGVFSDALSAQLEVALLSEQQRINQRALGTTQALHDRDRATDEQLDAAEDAVREGARRVVRAELAAERALEALSQTTGLPAEEITLPAAVELELDQWAEVAQTTLQEAQKTDLAITDSEVAKTRLEVESARLDLDAARLFTPDITVSASAGLPDWQYSVSAEVVLSPSQWDGSAVSDARSDLAAAEQAYDYAVRVAEFDVAEALGELEFAVSDLEVAASDVADARQDLAEAQFRFNRGDITPLALAQAELTVLSTDHALVKARLAVVSRLTAVQYAQW